MLKYIKAPLIGAAIGTGLNLVLSLAGMNYSPGQFAGGALIGFSAGMLAKLLYQKAVV